MKGHEMVPGIDPKIDYAFKRLFGREQNRVLLIHLIDSVLKTPPEGRISDLQVLNPFNQKETLDDKLSIVDIKARDQAGRQFHIEMQMLAEAFFAKRVLYYWARLHQQQLHEGEDYLTLKPTVSIAFVNATMFAGIPHYHLHFQLIDSRYQVGFTDDLAVHIMELPKFALPVSQLADPLDVWLYFLRHAESLDTDALPPALNIPIIHRALEDLSMLTQDDLERERYEARVRLQRDTVSRIKAAQVQGEKIGIIHLCQRRLNQPPTSTEELLVLPLAELERMAEQLEKELFA